MGKVIATVGVIVGAVALAATGIGAIAAPALAGAVSIGGVSASTLLLAGTALQAVGSALTKRPKLSSSSTERLNASLVTDTPRKGALGDTALNTDLRYQEWWGKDQEYCSQVFVLASHHCEAVEEVWLDDKLAWTATGGVMPAFAGYLVVMSYAKAGLGSVYRTGWSNRWGANATFNGCATLYLQFKVTGNGKKGQSPFSSSITSRVTVVGKGALLPDPRFDSTVGGSGAVRMADQTTWGWSTAGYESGRNPALALLFYLLGWRIQDPATGAWKLAVGRGVPVDRIDFGSFITAANMCDEIVQRAGGGSEPRYRCDGTFSEGDDPSQVIASLETCMNAKLRDSAGRFALQVLHNDLATPVVDFTDDDVLGDFTWTAGNDLNDRRNVVRGRYTNPGALYQLVDFPQVRLAPVDGIERIDSIDLALVQSPSQAQRLAKQRLQRQQYQGTFAAEFNARAWAVKDGDVVRLTFAALGFNRKLFRVAEGLIDTTGVVPLALVEEHADIYAWDRSEAPAVEAAEPNQFNPLLAPIIVAIDEAGKTAEWPAITGEGKPDDNATNSADLESPFGPVTVGEALATLDRIEPLSEAIELIDKAQIDYDALQRQATRDGAQMREAVLRGILELDTTRTVMRDAGITVDPATGRVFIAAVDQVSQRTSRVEIDLDAAKTLIALSASRDYVNERIAAAQLDPTGQAALDEVLLRLTRAEVRLDGDEATIALKADATIVTLLSGRVTSVRQDLDALAGVVSTKAERSEVDKLATTVSAVEQLLGDLGDTTGYSLEIREARYEADKAASNALEAIIAGDDLGRRQLVAAAQVRQELYTRLIEGDAAEAAARTLLSVRLGTAEAAAAAETIARVEQGKSLAQATSALEAKLGQDIAATVRTLNQAIAEGDKVSASSITQLGTRLDNFGGVTIEQSFKTLADRTGKIEARYTVAVDANENLSGFQLIGSDAGPASFNLINTDLKMGTGRIIFRGGSYESRGGANFGRDSNLVEWFGPAAVALGQETILNSRFCTANDGKVYYGGEDLSNGGFSANRVKQMPLTGSVGFAGNDTKQLSVAAALFPTGGKIKITGRLTAANARRDGGNGAEASGFWIIRFYANYGSGPQLIVETECSITPGAADLYDGILALSGRLFDNPGPGGQVNLSATVQRGGDPNSGIASNWTGSAIVEWVNA
jgi:hypothetical protein